MRSLPNANDAEKDGLTARWLDAKLDELRFVGITVRGLQPLILPHVRHSD